MAMLSTMSVAMAAMTVAVAMSVPVTVTMPMVVIVVWIGLVEDVHHDEVENEAENSRDEHDASVDLILDENSPKCFNN